MQSKWEVTLKSGDVSLVIMEGEEENVYEACEAVFGYERSEIASVALVKEKRPFYYSQNEFAFLFRNNTKLFRWTALLGGLIGAILCLVPILLYLLDKSQQQYIDYTVVLLLIGYFVASYFVCGMVFGGLCLTGVSLIRNRYSNRLLREEEPQSRVANHTGLPV